MSTQAVTKPGIDPADQRPAPPALAHGAGQRSLFSYLLLPRPKDAVKWWILPSTFALGTAAHGVSASGLLRAAVVWLVLELLIYQARYQWNDIRGFEADQRHPDVHARGRLPGPSARAWPHKLASASVAVARLAIAGALASALPGLNMESAVLELVLAVFGVAIVYESLRHHATGRSARVPPPLRPAILGLWAVVGGGYAIRGVAGLALAVDLGAHPGLAVAAAAMMWAYGIAFVTSRWAIEALAFARIDRGRLAWSVGADQAREHLLALTRWLPASGPPGHGSPWTWQPLRGPTAYTAPWNLAALTAAACAALVGQQLAGHAGARLTVFATAAGALMAVYVLRPGVSVRRPALTLGAVGFFVLLLAAGAARPVLAELPWLAVVSAQVFFCTQSLATMGRPLRAGVAARRMTISRRHG